MMKKNLLGIVLSAVWLMLSFISYTVWSFALTDPNLFLSQSEWFVSFQTWIWQTILSDRNLLTGWYLVSVTSAVLAYLTLIKVLTRSMSLIKNLTWYHGLIFWLLVTWPLFLSSNALSHDVFNYIFNAKMVVMYHANPHVQVALNFSFDNWTRFMHNTHTPAPYWYGWTALSLLPYYLGLGKFGLTWILFRLYSTLALVATGFSLLYMLKKDTGRLVKVGLLMFNPLVLIETISNSHNDYFMLLPAVWAMWLAIEHRLTVKKIILAVVLLSLSASTKLATILLLPILAWSVTIRLTLGLVWQKLRQKLAVSDWLDGLTLTVSQIKLWVWWLVSVVLFLPLLLPRSQQFLSWYLSWPLVFVPLFWLGLNQHQSANLIRLDPVSRLTSWQNLARSWWPEVLIVFSISSLLRYIPWLWQGLTYPDAVLTQQKWLTWGVPIGWLIIKVIINKRRPQLI